MIRWLIVQGWRKFKTVLMTCTWNLIILKTKAEEPTWELMESRKMMVKTGPEQKARFQDSSIKPSIWPAHPLKELIGLGHWNETVKSPGQWWFALPLIRTRRRYWREPVLWNLTPTLCTRITHSEFRMPGPPSSLNYEEQGTITGHATSPMITRMGPALWQKTLSKITMMPLLLHHPPAMPIPLSRSQLTLLPLQRPHRNVSIDHYVMTSWTILMSRRCP